MDCSFDLKSGEIESFDNLMNDFYQTSSKFWLQISKKIKSKLFQKVKNFQIL